MKKLKVVLKSLIICLMCSAVLTGGGYLYLNDSFKDAKNEENEIPYYGTSPENAGILVTVNNERFFAYLDFLEQELYVAFNFENVEGDELYGYPIDYKIKGNDVFIEEVIDEVGGIELQTEEGMLKFTGTQISELLKYNNSRDIRKEITQYFLSKISSKKMDKAVFFTMKKNCETNLKISECYFWYKYLPQICKNVNFID